MQPQRQQADADAFAENVSHNVRAGEAFLTRGRRMGMRGPDLRAFVANQLRLEDVAIQAFIRRHHPGLAAVESEAAPELTRAREAAMLALFPPVDRN